jgi:methylmalonyl-CoA mutase
MKIQVYHRRIDWFSWSIIEFDRITERGGVLGAMETMYQRSKIQEESLYYETLKHTGNSNYRCKYILKLKDLQRLFQLRWFEQLRKKNCTKSQNLHKANHDKVENAEYDSSSY